MTLNQFAIRLTSAHGPLDARRVTPNGLQGVFHDVLKRHDPRAATWLHDHPAPKPYTLAAAHYDHQRRQMAGLLISTLSQEASDCIIAAWRAAYEQRHILRFGVDGSPAEQPFVITELIPIDTTAFDRLTQAPPTRNLGLHFLTATAFSQGQGDLLFPLPRNVFMRPYEVWQTFAPEEFRLPADWLDWCEHNLFCSEHDIRTVPSNISRDKRFTGFIGKAWFQVILDRQDDRDHNLYTRILGALGRFITYSGIGRKTTMGMGAVEPIS